MSGRPRGQQSRSWQECVDQFSLCIESCCIDDDPVGSEAPAGKQSFKLAVPVVPDSDEVPDWRWLPVDVVNFSGHSYPLNACYT